ncbi:TPA: hypothetical protein HA273_02110 [Candidatus Bathyarchaeota archaeon]|nr:hypothetical protein [Candidatus Bathyarchaeota archaeon]
MAPSLVLEAIRKARNAIYYSLGEPAFIEVLIRDEAGKNKPSNDSILRFLIGIEGVVQQMTQIEEVNGEIIMMQADTLVQIASEIVETLTEERLEN